MREALREIFLNGNIGLKIQIPADISDSKTTHTDYPANHVFAL